MDEDEDDISDLWSTTPSLQDSLMFSPKNNSDGCLMEVNLTSCSRGSYTSARNNPPNELLIALYSIILILAVVGNVLVIVTLVQNKRMRTVTNVFLLNLAVSDLLLGIFCMPFTLIGILLRRFIFGEFMCKAIPYFQAVSVSVSVWTLVVISLERYFAICQPLRSRRWQTLSHAYNMIAVVWIISLVCMIPIVTLNQLQPMQRQGNQTQIQNQTLSQNLSLSQNQILCQNQSQEYFSTKFPVVEQKTRPCKRVRSGYHKCREKWPSWESEIAFNVFLDLMLLVLPLFIMMGAYVKITLCLCQGIQIEKQATNQAFGANSYNQYAQQQPQVAANMTGSDSSLLQKLKAPQIFNFRKPSRKITSNSDVDRAQDNEDPPSTPNSLDSPDTAEPPPSRKRFPMHQLRSTNFDKSLAAKKRVIRMLFMVVLEFFICWTPLYIANTLLLFGVQISPALMSYILLLAFVSSCCNPITYCFMNRKFRQAFLHVFGCGHRLTRRGTRSSANGQSFYNRSTNRTVVEDKELETQL